MESTTLEEHTNGGDSAPADSSEAPSPLLNFAEVVQGIEDLASEYYLEAKLHLLNARLQVEDSLHRALLFVCTLVAFFLIAAISLYHVMNGLILLVAETFHFSIATTEIMLGALMLGFVWVFLHGMHLKRKMRLNREMESILEDFH